jgi:hypothetical protein
MRRLFARSNGIVRVSAVVLLLGAVVVFVYASSASGGNMLTHNLSEPLNGATAARVDINAGDGNLTIDRLASGEQVLASGTLQYFEKQGLPTRMLVSRDGQAALTLRGSSAGQAWLHLPWETCNGATEWQIHLNPTVPSDITAHSNGGNVKLNLAGMAVSRVAADTGGGNVDVILPGNTADLGVTAKTGAGNVSVEVGSGITGSSSLNADSGAGNVVVRIPNGIAARIHATTGLGQATVDSRFSKTEKDTYQSPAFDTAANKIELTLHSGMGDVIVNTK